MATVQRRRINSPRRKLLVADQTRTRKMMRDALKEHGAEMQRAFEDVVSDWENRPTFVTEVKVTADALSVTVRPKRTRGRGGRASPSEIFGFVDKGTEPHVIRPRPGNKSKLLAFVWGGPGSYSAKTLPVAQAHAGSGKVVGGSLTFAREVHHPGNDARLFSETIQEMLYPDFRRTIEAAFRKMERDSKKK